ncbi:NTE family protein rssA [Kluyvera cryocrescens]|uniref:NTE family protein rssA n=1 Tax=Kluyvera cryocrescens TaxID=580 RepID=A0A485BL32_KLUCR|nr:NTE family protein rssA [Kluyvera cryocrescens]
MPNEMIEQCERRFAAVATNLSTGRELWFTEGDLHMAVRASCSIPGLMAPVQHNGYWLVDGAVVNPVPGLANARAGRRHCDCCRFAT